MTFDYQTLLQSDRTMDKLELQSFEMNIYLVKLTRGMQSGMLFHEGRPMRFSSTQQVRDTFEDWSIATAVMTHQSPYDEMIGNPPGAATPMEVPFSLSQPY